MVSTLLQRAARSFYTGYRYLSPGVDSHKMLCEPSMEYDGQGSCINTTPTGSSSASDSQPWFPPHLNMLIDHPCLIVQN